MDALTARTRFVLVAGVALVLAVPILLFFLGRLVLSHDPLLLHHVAERRTPLVELSLWAGADPNYRDADGRAALPLAVESGDYDVVPLLLDAGADPDTRTADGEPVAAIAVRDGETAILAMLLRAGADSNARAESGIPILVPAAIQGNAAIVQMLLDAGADPNTLAEENLSVLAIAVDRGHTEVARLLLDAGADPNGPGIAELVRQSGNIDLLELLEAGALTAEALFTLAELGLNALANLDKIIEGMLCIFTLGLGC
ncbi:MAG: ankyrin repeat domain-containing protein [Chloroflexi bacterium]|nr:ankyrin repeat domain-containing protein [Chloroflexota bacterium]